MFNFIYFNLIVLNYNHNLNKFIQLPVTSNTNSTFYILYSSPVSILSLNYCCLNVIIKCFYSSTNIYIIFGLMQSAYPAFSIIGNVFTILLVHRLGKRYLVLSTITVCSLSYILIGFIGQFYGDTEYTSWAKLALFFGSTLSSSLGVMPIGWILMSEVFPMK